MESENVEILEELPRIHKRDLETDKVKQLIFKIAAKTKVLKKCDYGRESMKKEDVI